MSGKKRNKKEKKNNKILNKLIIIITIVCLILCGIYLYLDGNNSKLDIKKPAIKTMYLANDINEVSIFDLEEQVNEETEEVTKILVENKKIPRGIEVKVSDKKITYEDKTYYLSKIEDTNY